MKKFVLLLIIAAFTLAIDGVLTYDILEFKIDTQGEWLALGLILAIVGTIYWAETGKKNDD